MSSIGKMVHGTPTIQLQIFYILDSLDNLHIICTYHLLAINFHSPVKVKMQEINYVNTEWKSG